MDLTTFAKLVTLKPLTNECLTYKQIILNAPFYAFLTFLFEWSYHPRWNDMQ